MVSRRWARRAAMFVAGLAAEAIARIVDPGAPKAATLTGLAIGALIVGYIIS